MKSLIRRRVIGLATLIVRNTFFSLLYLLSCMVLLIATSGADLRGTYTKSVEQTADHRSLPILTTLTPAADQFFFFFLTAADQQKLNLPHRIGLWFLLALDYYYSDGSQLLNSDGPHTPALLKEPPLSICVLTTG